MQAFALGVQAPQLFLPSPTHSADVTSHAAAAHFPGRLCAALGGLRAENGALQQEGPGRLT